MLKVLNLFQDQHDIIISLSSPQRRGGKAKGLEMYYSCRFVGVLLMPFIVCLYTTMSYAIVLPHLTSHPRKPFFVKNDCYARHYSIRFTPLGNKEKGFRSALNTLHKMLWKDREQIYPFEQKKKEDQQIPCQSEFTALWVYTSG